MSRSRFAFLLVILAIGSYSVSAAGEPPALTIHGWGTVIDPDQDCRVAVEGSRLKVTVPATSHEFAAELERWNSPRIMQGIRGDFIAEVKVCGALEPPPGRGNTKGRKAYNGGGLLLVADEMNHLNLHRAAFRQGDRVRHYLNFVLRRDGKTVEQRFNLDIPDEDCWVRIERHGSQFKGMVSPDGVNWQSYEPIESDFPADAQIGVAVVNSTKLPFKCAFEDFSLFHRKGKK